MDIEIRELRKKDYKKAIQTIKGMNLNRYVDEGFFLNLYGRYFWYLELLQATQVIAAYYDNKFVGVLLAQMKNEKKVYKSFWNNLYVKIFDFLQKIFIREAISNYDLANKEMLEEYCKNNNVDGEIVFLAADLEAKIKGIGTKLLEEFEKREKDKIVYLYTDNHCIYQFYDNRGFTKVGEREIEMEIDNKKIPMVCMLYSKKIK